MKYSALWLEDTESDIPPYVREVCGGMDIQVQFVRLIAQAAEITENQHIDLFLLDIEIADERMTGTEYAHWLRSLQEHYQTPIIFVSNHTHLARHLFATIGNCRFLAKPYTAQSLEKAIGSALGIDEYVEQKRLLPLWIPVKRERMVEVNALTVCYIEFLKNNSIRIQFHNNECLVLQCQRGVRKALLDQIQQSGFDHLVQIYRSFVVNIHEIRCIQSDGREEKVYLFGDDTPKPLGARYRDNVRDFV